MKEATSQKQAESYGPGEIYKDSDTEYRWYAPGEIQKPAELAEAVYVAPSPAQIRRALVELVAPGLSDADVGAVFGVVAKL